VKFEINDGFVSSGEPIWIVTDLWIEKRFEINRAHIKDYHYDSKKQVTLYDITIDFEFTVNVTGFSQKDLRNNCFKDYENAESGLVLKTLIES